MYKLRYYSTTGDMLVKYFATINEALHYSVYSIPFQSFYGIDKIEENNA